MKLSSVVRLCLAILVTSAFGLAEAAAQVPLPTPAPPVAVGASMEQVPVLLRSANARDVAWGAFLAMQYRMTGAVPLLAQALERASATSDQSADAAGTAAILDALIQLDARLDPALVRRFLPIWSVQTLLLLDRAALGRDEALVSALDEVGGDAWRATVALLFASRPPGLAVRVLRPMRFSLQVRVQDRADGGLGDGVGGGVTEGCNYAPRLLGFPPLAEYQFSRFPRPGVVVLALPLPGASYVRTVRADMVPCASPAASRNGPTLQERLDYAMAFVLPPSVVPWEMPRSTFQVSSFGVAVWSDPQALRERVRELRRGVEVRYEGLLHQLVFAKLLTEAESKELLPMVVDVSVVDRRQDQAIPLPPIE